MAPTRLSTRTAVEGEPRKRLTPFEQRFDAVACRLLHLSKTAPTETMRRECRDLATEMRALSRDLVAVESAAPPAVEPTDGRKRKGHHPNYVKKNRDGQRFCQKHNDGKGAWLPAAEFAVKVQSTGQLKSWCQVCTKEYQRERYVRVGSKVTVEVLEDDPCIGHLCPLCDEPFEPGQRVQGHALTHEACIDAMVPV